MNDVHDLWIPWGSNRMEQTWGSFHKSQILIGFEPLILFYWKKHSQKTTRHLHISRRSSSSRMSRSFVLWKRTRRWFSPSKTSLPQRFNTQHGPWNLMLILDPFGAMRFMNGGQKTVQPINMEHDKKNGVYVGNSWAPKSQLWLFQNSLH